MMLPYKRVSPRLKPWLEIKYDPWSESYMMHVSSFHYTNWKYFKVFLYFLFFKILNPFFIPRDTAVPGDRKRLIAKEKKFKKYWKNRK